MLQTTSKRRRGSTRNLRSTMSTLCIVGVCVIALLECQALPHPRPQETSDDLRRNFALNFDAPLITPLQEDVILDVNTNYQLRCEASDEMEWYLPVQTVPFEIQSFDTLDPERPHGSELKLTDISVHNVGYYYCIKKAAMEKFITILAEEDLIELVNNNQATNIYIYVNDKSQLLVPIEMGVGHAHQYKDITIPCKPTVPSVEVLLTTPNGQTFSSENTGRYDPRRGFVVEIRGLPDAGTFICRPKKPLQNNEEEDTQIEILFDGNEHMDKNNSEAPMSTSTPTPITTAVLVNQNNLTTEITATDTSNKRFKAEGEALTTTIESTVTNDVNLTNNPVVVVNAGEIVVANNVNQINVTTLATVCKSVLQSVDGEGVNFYKNNNKTTQSTFNATTQSPTKRYHRGEIVVSNISHESINGGGGGGSTFFQTVTITVYENLVNDGLGGGSDGGGGDDDDSDKNVDDDFGVDVGMGVGYHASAHFLSKRAVSPGTSVSHRLSRSSSANTKRPRTNHINKPIIISESNGHVYEGGTFTLTCVVSIAHDVRYGSNWITPPGVDPSRQHTKAPTFNNYTATHRDGTAVLTIENAQKSDEGKYKCHVYDHSNNTAYATYTMIVLRPGETYLNVSEPAGYYNITEKANNTVQMTVKYRGYPMPTLEWQRADGTKIANVASKYSVNTTATTSTLKILHAQMEDTGDYYLHATNDVNIEKLKFSVNIMNAPKVSVADVYVQMGGEAHVTCKVLAYPKPFATFAFTPCSITPNWPTCNKRYEQSFNSTRNVRQGESSIEYLYDLYFTPDTPGMLYCVAGNAQGKSTGKGHILIGDISDNMTVYGVDEHRKIARGDGVTITCAVLAYFFSDEIRWYKDGAEVEETDGITIATNTSDYSYKKSIIFKSIQERDEGSYECRARHAMNFENVEGKYINLFVHEPLAPHIISTNLEANTKIERKLGDPLELECKSEAIPRANVDWYKDEVKIHENQHIHIEEENTKLLIKYIRPEDEGEYKCVVSNRMGTVAANASVKITNLPGVRLGWILGIVFFFILLIVLVIYLCMRVNRERKLLRELKAAGLANFEEGALEHINPALSLDEQADLLPYDRNFEFPREKLKLGKQLGAGAFGVVLKADAEGIKPEERETVVAVKMVKRTADNEVMRALVSELKIMVHLGQHLNVVNLLGAVTKNIAKRELMVIVEYCRFGNIQNFLLRNRKRFIDQINSESDKIDPTITKQRFSDYFETNRNSDSDPRSGTRAGRPNSKGYLRQSDLYEGHVDSCATEQTVMTTVPEDDDNVLSNNSVQPAWRSNYKPDSTEAMTITTSDLVSWAFQVARGMDYLSSKKVLHGDLAARNILLCEDNVVKICDFGLARSMYKGDNYKKQGEAPLPIKWLALESLSDHIFSTYTDVWSFGIVLWEFFSLAKVPYPGMDPNQNLYLKLKDGYRMDKPAFANNELYDIMLECWSTNPESRPLFNVLEKRFARMLGDEVTSHYVDLNEPYLRTNTEYMKRNQTDYLALMGSPDDMAPPPPRYVNGHILPEIRIDSSSDDYLQMSTNTGTTIFSPTRPKDYEDPTKVGETNANSSTSFTFPDTSAAQPHSPTLVNNLDSPVNKNRKKEGVAVEPEEIPMLHALQHNSEGEQSPESTGRKFANILQQARPTPTPSPRHHVAETELDNDDTDGYVNVKRTAPKKPDAFFNPSYQMLKTVTTESDKP